MIPGGWNRQREASNKPIASWLCGRHIGGWNSQIETNNKEYYPDPVQSALEKKEMIPSGWISQREATNTQHHPGLVKDNMEEKEMIPGGWNRQRKAGNKQQDSGSVEGHTTKPSSNRYLQLSRLVLSWRGLGIILQLYIYLSFFSVSETVGHFSLRKQSRN